MKLVRCFWVPDYDCDSVPVFDEAKGKLEYVISLCERKNTVIQAGGHFGTFPAKLAEHFTEVHTFEPDEENHACLVRNLEDYDVVLYPYALGDVSKDITLVNQHAKNCASIYVKNDVERKGEFLVKEGVKQVRLDDPFFAFTFGSLDLMYLDIEGSEYRTLVGAEKLIKKFKPVLALENKGLIPGFVSRGTDGASGFKDYVCSLGYKFHKRIARDDVFLPD